MVDYHGTTRSRDEGMEDQSSVRGRRETRKMDDADELEFEARKQQKRERTVRAQQWDGARQRLERAW